MRGAKRPRLTAGYRSLGTMTVDGDLIERWSLDAVIVGSSRCMCEHRRLIVPQDHLSISKAGKRADDETVRAVLADFEMEDALEDNHVSGIARHFWLVVGATKQDECECKETEETVTEPDGYKWQRPRDV